MKCQTESVWPNRVWYKLGTNKNLHLIASTNKVFQQNPTFDPRYSVKSSASETTLTILHMTKEDVGTYYCGIVNPDDIFFGSGTVLELEGDSKPVQTELQSPDYIRVQPGGSVTLTCSFNTNACSEQTSVTWIKSGWTTEIITQSSGIKNIVCGNTDGTSCVHNLTVKDVSSAEDGTYFCVVSACGHSLTGTKIHVNSLVVTSEPDSFYSNGIALIVSNNLAVLVVFVLLFGLWRASTKAGKCHDRKSMHNQPDDTLTYTTESLMTLSKSTTIKRRRDPEIYTQVWYSHRD
ncbi:hypothetical protein WMY93_017257 [Mugilogobius chulae]|uniref:Ig-like domain-containing protein n=1 Tax=Mugilogobius chulae TaxID=88201 RepID=A0AAW0NMQ9_9GOBI